MDNSYQFKIIVVGGVGVGKTCCIQRFCNNLYNPEYKVTIGADQIHSSVHIRQGRKDIKVGVDFWDIGGQNKIYKTMDKSLQNGYLTLDLTRAYYNHSFGCIVVGDLSDPTNFLADIKKWKRDINEKVRFPFTNEQETIPIILMINKVDIARNNYTSEIRTELSDLDFDGIFCTSALTGEGLKEAIEFITLIMIEKFQIVRQKYPQPSNIIDPEGTQVQKSWCCW
ncbi:Rab32 [Hexamita inflata]|uniref:Putative n=1 Tax=Hexamita inflata TaxID=28002 RepID=A0AA86QIR1_9EUKA|nr:Rab32 [Hexamita inflata]CAI9954302.1 Rab32 [Hexamita inflata]